MESIKVESMDTSKIVFLLDPGHGSDTLGKRSPSIPPGIYEWEFNRDIVRRILELAPISGIQCVDLVVQEKSIPLKERIRRANAINEFHRTAFISIHANAAGVFGWNKASGFRVFTKKKYNKFDNALADFFIDRMRREVISFRGVSYKKRKNFSVLAKTSMPAVLTENGFMTNKNDCKLLSQPTWRQEIAWSHVHAMIDYSAYCA